MMNRVVYTNRSPLRQWLRYHFLEKKLNTYFGYFFLLLIGILMTYGVAVIDIKIGLVTVFFITGLLLLVLIIKHPYFGFYFLIVFASLTVTIDRLVNLPVPSGMLIEVFNYFAFLSVLLNYNLKKNINLRFWTNPISIGQYILFAYYLIELFNPEMISQLGWFSFFRKQISYFVFYYMCYCLLDSKEKIIYFVRFMICFTSILALYACKQQWFGYAAFEMRYIGTDGISLLLQAGLLRKFSVFSDPSTSGILFASIAMLCIILYIRTTNKKEKIWLAIAAVTNLLGYSFSGTRTATLMILMGIILYCISTLYEKRTIIFMVVCAGFIFSLFVLPFQTPVTYRIKSTFEGTKDASASLRDFDRNQVQPYIQAHPLGGGIFTCGFEGPKYSKGHYLEYLQPDSGYMKTLAEQGEIGLAILLIFYFIVMRHGFHFFFRVKDPEIQNYYIGLLAMMFTLLVAQYSQMAIYQYPVTLYFYATLIIFIKLADFDKAVDPVKKTIQN